MKASPPILAAVDFSSSSMQVLAHASKLASGMGREVIAVHVISEGRLRDWEATMGCEASTAERVRELTRRLGDLAAESCGGISAKVTVRIGRPYRVLRNVVDEEGADLLVLGAHDVSKGRLGAVAAHCARSIPADVLILRDWQGRRIVRIAACVDFNRCSTAALGRAIEIARIHQASLEIIHVTFPASRDPWGRLLEQRMDDPIDYETVVWERARKRMAEFLAPFESRLAKVENHTVFLEGESPAAAITAHVKAENIDLTVMGSHTESWVEEFILGSNAERLTHDSTSSVLVVRDREVA